MNSQPFGTQVEKPADGGRRFAIADIHGCFYTFQALIKRIQFSAGDQLFILGDMINRGKNAAVMYLILFSTSSIAVIWFFLFVAITSITCSGR